jgi:hypothetical protein
MLRGCVAIALLALTSCDAGGAATTPPKGTGAEGPEAIFQRAAAACDRQDWGAYYDCTDPEDTALLIRLADVACGFAIPDTETARADYKAVREKWKLPAAKSNLEISEMRKAGEELCKGLTDRRAVFVDIFACMVKHAEPKRVSMLVGGTLSEVVITGDSARGRVTKDAGKPKPVSFRKRADQWYLSFEE